MTDTPIEVLTELLRLWEKRNESGIVVWISAMERARKVIEAASAGAEGRACGFALEWNTVCEAPADDASHTNTRHPNHHTFFGSVAAPSESTPAVTPVRAVIVAATGVTASAGNLTSGVQFGAPVATPADPQPEARGGSCVCPPTDRCPIHQHPFGDHASALSFPQGETVRDGAAASAGTAAAQPEAPSVPMDALEIVTTRGARRCANCDGIIMPGRAYLKRQRGTEFQHLACPAHPTTEKEGERT